MVRSHKCWNIYETHLWPIYYYSCNYCCLRQISMIILRVQISNFPKKTRPTSVASIYTLPIGVYLGILPRKTLLILVEHL